MYATEPLAELVCRVGAIEGFADEVRPIACRPPFKPPGPDDDISQCDPTHGSNVRQGDFQIMHGDPNRTARKCSARCVQLHRCRSIERRRLRQHAPCI